MIHYSQLYHSFMWNKLGNFVHLICKVHHDKTQSIDETQLMFSDPLKGHPLHQKVYSSAPEKETILFNKETSTLTKYGNLKTTRTLWTSLKKYFNNQHLHKHLVTVGSFEIQKIAKVA